MLYGLPVSELQSRLTPQDFAELEVYDELCGLTEHRDIEQEREVDVEAMARARFSKDKKPTGKGLNRKPIEVPHG